MTKRIITRSLVNAILGLMWCVTFVLNSPVQASDKKEGLQVKPQVQWARMFSKDDWSDNLGPALIHSSDGGYYVIGASHKKNSQGKFDRENWIWKIDANGKRLWGKTPVMPGIDENQNINWSTTLSLKNERLILVRESQPKTRPWLIRFNENGDITSARKLEFLRSSYTLRSFERTNGGLLISGQKLGKSTNAWALKVDDEGNELWHKEYDNGKSEDVMSMAVAKDGSFTLAVNSGKYNKFGAGESSIWIIRCDSKGDIISEAVFDGRHPTIAMANNGVYAVCFNTADFPSVNLQIMGLDKKLKKIWGPHAMYNGQGIGMYNIKPDSGGNFIVAGAKFGEVWLWKYDNNGKELWSNAVRTQMSVAMINALLVADNEYIMAGAGMDLALAIKNYDPERKKTGPNEHRDTTDIFIAKVAEAAERAEKHHGH